MLEHWSEQSHIMTSREREELGLKHLVERLPLGLIDHLIAHRGFHSTKDKLSRPIENTLAAFTTAWKSGVRRCECDVTHSSDGVVVVSHDSTFARLAKDTQADELHSTALEELTFQRLQGIVLKDDSSVLPLSAVLEALQDLDVQNESNPSLVIEIKKTAEPEVITQSLFRLLYPFHSSTTKTDSGAGSAHVRERERLQLERQKKKACIQSTYHLIPVVMSFSYDIMTTVAVETATMRRLHPHLVQEGSSFSLPKLLQLTGLKAAPTDDSDKEAGCKMLQTVKRSRNKVLAANIELEKYSFDLGGNLDELMQTVKEQLLHRTSCQEPKQEATGSGDIDGLYIQFERRMIEDGRARQNLKTLCELCPVGVWFSKTQPDELSTVLKLRKLGVTFINTDLPPSEAFFDTK